MYTCCGQLSGQTRPYDTHCLLTSRRHATCCACHHVLCKPECMQWASHTRQIASLPPRPRFTLQTTTLAATAKPVDQRADFACRCRTSSCSPRRTRSARAARSSRKRQCPAQSAAAPRPTLLRSCSNWICVPRQTRQCQRHLSRVLQREAARETCCAMWLPYGTAGLLSMASAIEPMARRLAARAGTARRSHAVARMSAKLHSSDIAVTALQRTMGVNGHGAFCGANGTAISLSAGNHATVRSGLNSWRQLAGAVGEQRVQPKLCMCLSLLQSCLLLPTRLLHPSQTAVQVARKARTHGVDSSCALEPANQDSAAALGTTSLQAVLLAQRQVSCTRKLVCS